MTSPVKMVDRVTHIKWLATLDRALVFGLRTICVCCLALLLLILSGNVFVRHLPVAAFYWFDEVVEWIFAWMVFFGASALWARDEHFKLEWINAKIKGTRAGHALSVGLELISLFFLVIFFYQALRLTLLAKDWTPVFNVSRRYLYVCMPVSGLIMVGYSIRNVIREIIAYWRFKDETEEKQSS
ncbi:MAG: TRAP transporter small permease [Desulfosarcinaceae bacterium]|jgi:TRAP-type transport system small permease protein